MIILSIDPGGKNTGIVMARFLDGISLGIIMTTLDSFETNSFLRKKIEFVSEVVIERMPSSLPFPLSNIIAGIDMALITKKVTKISPATWKPISKARGWSHPKAKTQHEQDAFCMLRYYLDFYYKWEGPK